MKKPPVLLHRLGCTYLLIAIILVMAARMDEVCGSLPPVTDGLITALDGSNVMTVGSSVTSWNDQSGSLNHASQANTDSQPIIVNSATPTGMNALSFDGVDDFLDIAANASDFDFTGVTWYAVRQTSSNDDARFFSSMYADIDSVTFGDQYSGLAWGSFAGSSSRHRTVARDISNTFYSANAFGTDETNFFVTGGTWDTLSSTDNLSSILIPSPGERVVDLVSIIDNAELGGHLRTRIGAAASVNDRAEIDIPTNVFTGQIAEILIYDRVLSASEQTMVESYLYDKHIGSGPAAYSWNTADSGNWTEKQNWTDPYFGPPVSKNATAILGDAIGANNRTVFLDEGITVNGVVFDNQMGGSYAVAGFGAVTLAESDSLVSPSISVTQGNHQFQAPVIVENDTSVSVVSGALDFSNEIDLGGNAMTLSGEVNINHSVVGGGSINNHGTLGTAGTTSIVGNLTSSDVLSIDLGSNNTDFFDITGSATLSGTLDVDLEAGYLPTGAYTVLTASAGLNAAGLSLDSGDEAMFDLLIQGNSLVLTASGIVGNADFDGDHDVDGADFLAWQRGFGTSSGATASDGDANLDGAVNAADLSIWNAQFGSSSSLSGIAVPEPASAILVSIACVLALVHRARKVSGVPLLLLLCLFGSRGYMSEAQAALPPVTNGLITQLDANTGVTLDAGLVSDWADQSGFGNNALQGLADYRPSVASAATPAGSSALIFDGTDDFLDIGASSDFVTNQLSWMMVFKVDGVVPNVTREHLFNSAYSDVKFGTGTQWSGQAWGTTIYDSNRLRTLVRDEDDDGTPGFHAADSAEDNIEADRFYAVISTWDGTNSTTDNIRQILIDDSGAIISDTTGASWESGPDINPTFITHYATRIGGAMDYDNAPASNPAPVEFNFEGQIAEVLVYDTLLDTADLTSIEDYLVTKHFSGEGLSSNTFSWVSDGSGNWADHTNWSDSFYAPPANPNRIAAFGDAIGSESRTVYLDSAVTINGISFNNSAGGSYAIAGTAGITLAESNSQVAPSINVIAGNHQFQTSLTLADDTIVNAGGGSIDFNNEIDLNGNTLTLSGDININSRIVGGGTVINSGSLATIGSSSFASALVSDGTLVIGLGEEGADSFNILNDATLSGTLDVVVDAGAVPGGTYTVLTSGGTLNAGNLVLDESDAGMFDLVVSGNSLMLVSLVAVPEPTTAVLLMASCVLAIGSRRKHDMKFHSKG